MSLLMAQVASLYRDPEESDHDESVPVPTLDQLETTLTWALRDGFDEFAAVLAHEIRRIREPDSRSLEAVLIANTAGLWRLQ